MQNDGLDVAVLDFEKVTLKIECRGDPNVHTFPLSSVVIMWDGHYGYEFGVKKAGAYRTAIKNGALLGKVLEAVTYLQTIKGACLVSRQPKVEKYPREEGIEEYQWYTVFRSISGSQIKSSVLLIEQDAKKP